MKWEISMKKIGSVYKVTRRIPDAGISETLMFEDEKEAMAQFQEWSKA